MKTFLIANTVLILFVAYLAYSLNKYNEECRDMGYSSFKINGGVNNSNSYFNVSCANADGEEVKIVDK